MLDWLADLESEAAERLPWYVREYFAGTVGSAQQRDRALAEWDAVRFRPAVLRGGRDLDLRTRVLGREIASPVMVPPMSQQLAAHPDGEAETARGVVRAGSLLGVSTNTGVEFERIADAGAPWWFQLYAMNSPEVEAQLVDRAVAAGASAIILTVDLSVAPMSKPGVDPLEWPDGPAKRRYANVAPDLLAGASRGFRPVGTDDIRGLAERSGLPVVVKGVLRGDDARAAVDAGASGLIVSTHGDRRMPGSVSSLRALPEVVDAVGDRAEVYVDSGIRSGAHVLAALALGARAVFVGRPVLWALASRGADGVAETLDRFAADTTRALAQSGMPSRAALGPDLIASF
ncbi:alpha-hydroxy acid oxidase [Pseudolysinimonas sp.]|uniref:alpha-hydroxy acid oxidase n=1 Tax=Pseudolysinimonas sp. TaxID=2680009 RepID=UPI003F7FA882